MQAWVIYRYGVNVPIRDEWNFIPFVRQVVEGGKWWEGLFAQYNENRVVIGRLVIAANVWLTRWNVVAQMYFGLVATSLSLLGLYKIYRRAGNTSLWAFIPVSWICVNLIQHQNYLFGIQISFLLAVTAIIWTCYLISLNSLRFIIAAIALGIVATFSAASGLMVWFMGLGQLLGQRAPFKWVAFWGLAAGLVYFTYFYGFSSRRAARTLTASLANPLATFQYFFTLLGAPLGADRIPVAQAIGIVLLVLCAGYAVLIVRARRLPPPNEWGALGLVLFALLIGALITVGRSYLQVTQALLSRYTSITVLGILGVYIWGAIRLSRSSWSRALTFGIVPLLLIAGLANNQAGLEKSADWSRKNGRNNFFLLRTQDLQVPQVETSLWGGKWLRRLMKQDTAYLQTNQLSLFNEPANWWLTVANQPRTPLAPINSNSPVAQTFTCPVDTLHDIGIHFANPIGGSPASAQLQLIDEQTNQVLASRLVSLSNRGDSWVFLSLPQPEAQCRDKVLRLEITAPADAPQNTFAAFSVPTLYRGTLRQAGQTLPGASLQMELNSGFYDIRMGE